MESLRESGAATANIQWTNDLRSREANAKGSKFATPVITDKNHLQPGVRLPSSIFGQFYHIDMLSRIRSFTQRVVQKVHETLSGLAASARRGELHLESRVAKAWSATLSHYNKSIYSLSADSTEMEQPAKKSGLFGRLREKAQALRRKFDRRALSPEREGHRSVSDQISSERPRPKRTANSDKRESLGLQREPEEVVFYNIRNGRECQISEEACEEVHSLGAVCSCPKRKA